VEGVVQDGSTGWSVADQDLQRFTEGLRAHALELSRKDSARREMGEAARADALERYSWSRVVESHLAVYRAVAPA
jgi:glycosyltransferase involved in cell wall biosynthesis